MKNRWGLLALIALFFMIGAGVFAGTILSPGTGGMYSSASKVTAFPDVCKTPAMSSAPVPIPYVNKPSSLGPKPSVTSTPMKKDSRLLTPK